MEESSRGRRVCFSFISTAFTNRQTTRDSETDEEADMVGR